jgi:hypothetical protein
VECALFSEENERSRQPIMFSCKQTIRNQREKRAKQSASATNRPTELTLSFGTHAVYRTSEPQNFKDVVSSGADVQTPISWP